MSDGSDHQLFLSFPRLFSCHLADLHFLVLEYYQRFAACCKPSVFTSMNLDFDNDSLTFFRVLLTFLHVVKGNDSGCFLCSSRPFDVVELTTSFFRFYLDTPTIVPVSLIDLFGVFSTLTMASFFSMDFSLDFILIAPIKQCPNANSTIEMNSRPFICFIWCEVTRDSWSIVQPFSYLFAWKETDFFSLNKTAVIAINPISCYNVSN